MGDKLRSAVGGNMPMDPMLGKDTNNKELGKFGRCNSVVDGDEYCLFGEMINNDEDGVIA
jgi:hypothetical protein